MNNQSTAVARTEPSKDLIAKIALNGNLKMLSETDRWQYYQAYCEHLGLEPTTRPFDLVENQGKLSLYPNANCSAQLGYQMQISFPEYRIEVFLDQVINYHIKAVTNDGREAWGLGSVPIGRTALETASAVKKAETQAKRRVILSLGGLGLTDSDDLRDHVPEAQIVQPEPESTKPSRKLNAVPKVTEEAKAIGRDVAEGEAIPVEAYNGLPHPDPAKQSEADEAMIAEAKKALWNRMRDYGIPQPDAKTIWRHFAESAKLCERFVTFYPKKCPSELSLDDALTVWESVEGNLERACKAAEEYAQSKKQQAAYAQQEPTEPPQEPTANLFDDDAPWNVPDEPKTPQQAAFDAQAPAITRATRDIRGDNVGFDSTPFHKWTSFIGIRETKPNRDRIAQIIELNTERLPVRGKPGETREQVKWKAVIHQVKQEFTA